MSWASPTRRRECRGSGRRRWPTRLRATVFISYAREDRAWHDRVVRALRVLELLGTVEIFSDEDIAPGSDWEAEILAQLWRADAVIALVSEHFLASDYVMRVELPAILARAERGETRLWWYLLTPCAYEQTGLARIQAAHSVESPLEAVDQAPRWPPAEALRR